MTKKVLCVNGPSQDPSDRFFGWPTPLLYAIAPSVAAARRGEMNLEFSSGGIFDPVWYVEGHNDATLINEFAERIVREQIDVVCASAIYDSVYPTIKLLEVAKRVNPGILTIFGGPHFDEVHTIDVLNDIKLRPDVIDVAIAGDGEHALKATLEAIARGKNISEAAWADVEGRAVVYTNDGGVFNTSGRPIELNNVPFMPVEFSDVGRHKNDFDIFSREGRILPTVQMIASRGCPYSCHFCSEGRSLAYPNARSVENIIQEIELRKSQGFEAVFFDDSTFAAHPQHRELLRKLGETGIVFGCLNRFNHLHRPDVVQAYVDAGVEYIYAAIEQFSNDALKQMGKNQGEAEIERSLGLLRDAGMKVGVSLLYGLPYETEESIGRTLDFTQKWVQEGTIKLVSESVLSYHPGTLAGSGKVVDGFHRAPPHIGRPWNRFEEGQWYHPDHVTANYLDKILGESEKRFSEVMVRNRHSWYARENKVV